MSGTDENMCNLFSLVTEPALPYGGAGSFEASVIESYEVSEDGLTYVFISGKVKFHEEYGKSQPKAIVYCVDRICKADVSGCVCARYSDAVSSL